MYQLDTSKRILYRTALEGLHDNNGSSRSRKDIVSWSEIISYWPNMAKYVATHIKSYANSVLKRKTQAQVVPMPSIQNTHPVEFVAMDYLTIEKAMGYENISGNYIDHFTNFV